MCPLALLVVLRLWRRSFCTLLDFLNQKLSFWFKSANCSVMIWGCFGWSGLGAAIQPSSWMYWMTRLSHQWIFFFPNGSGVSQDDNAKIHRALVVKERSMWTHECQGEHEESFSQELTTTESCLYPINSLWDVLEKTKEGMVCLSCQQY